MSEEDIQWIRGAFDRLETKVDRIETKVDRLESNLQLVETTFAEKLERVETTLLTEFHKWASPFEARQRTHSAALRALDLETEWLADQVKKIQADRSGRPNQ
jgi:hypothetical protein